MVVDVLCRASTQGGAESQMNTATTLTTDHDRTIIAHKSEAVALQGNIIDRDAGMNGAGVGEDVCFTLNTVDRHGVAKAFETAAGGICGNAAPREDRYAVVP